MIRRQKASYTIEAAIYIPIVLFVMFYSIEIGIDFWQESKERSVATYLQELDVTQEFYIYQIMDEAMREIVENE